ncbi:MAG: tetraacyldisaccharide 4'-kinase [Candidatus Omnitrophica bacterium]|nr:tetraacyldisaccharide 4'-kinase [Candidatus Omnitrophota bacterium]
MKKFLSSTLTSFYHFGLWLDETLYRLFPGRIRKSQAKVISVGNITWGGTGKTPLVTKLARDLAYYGKKVAVLIRGYGRDEVEELRRSLPNIPVIVGRDRVRSAKTAVQKYGAEILVLDDGFQHRRLHRDLDIVNINTTLPFGNGKLIPAGILREPLENLKRAHLFVLTKSNIGAKNVQGVRQKLQELKPNALIFEASHKPMRFWDARRSRTVTLGEMRGRKASTLCAIGDPYSFEKTVENLGIEIAFAARFDDHHPYTRKDLTNFLQECRRLSVTDVVTTEKDYIRIEPVISKGAWPELDGSNLLTLQIEFQIHDEEDFLRRCLNP